MTVGQRIARKRKELGLSQEGLGERLGVSRQAIYKWESGAALPEIEKLVNLSREFSVPVGWLLGEEDGAPERPELTAEQIRMVEEIVGRYLDARPAAVPQEKGEPEEGGTPERLEPPKPRRRRRWSWVTFFVAAASAYLSYNLFFQLDQMRRETRELQMAVSNIRSDVNRQIGTITSRVEDILQNQSDLTAEQSAQVVETDCRANTAVIQARAVPRTFVEGMTAEFTVVSGGETFTAAGELGENHAFTARITVPLTDGITVSAAFLNGDQRQTQVLEEFTGLYTMSFPGITVTGGIYSAVKTQGDTAWTVAMQTVDVDCYDQRSGGPVELKRLQVGLFRDQKLVQWLNEEGQDGSTGKRRTFRLEQETIRMEIGHTYCVAAVVKDEFDREWVAPDQSGGYAAAEDCLVTPSAELSRDPADWEYLRGRGAAPCRILIRLLRGGRLKGAVAA